jgi:diadenosine tetraphosphate (Ap4A) HIT family hydrolase
MEQAGPECHHCPGGIGLEHVLIDDEYFWVVCDIHPIVEGHILIITKEHISCMGALDDIRFARYKELYTRVLSFLNMTYGKAGIFEHGTAGQTVFHAHTSLFPFSGSISDVIPERNSVHAIPELDSIRTEYDTNHKYLYVALDGDKWMIDTRISHPGLFRERFPILLGTVERGDWKRARGNSRIMATFRKDILELKRKWKSSVRY